MKHLTLSIKDVEKACIKLSEKIKQSSFKPDCIVYIKTGGYLVGKEVSNYFNIQVKGLRISREGNDAKKKLGFLLKIMPKSIKSFLREIEIRSGVHKKHSSRTVSEVDDKLIAGKNILLVDDSIDTGNTIIEAIKYLKKNHGEELNIKVVGLNKFNSSNDIVNTDYYLYEDSIINYPWSKDSKEYNTFIDLYTSREEKYEYEKDCICFFNNNR